MNVTMWVGNMGVDVVVVVVVVVVGGCVGVCCDYSDYVDGDGGCDEVGEADDDECVDDVVVVGGGDDDVRVVDDGVGGGYDGCDAEPGNADNADDG